MKNFDEYHGKDTINTGYAPSALDRDMEHNRKCTRTRVSNYERILLVIRIPLKSKTSRISRKRFACPKKPSLLILIDLQKNYEEY